MMNLLNLLKRIPPRLMLWILILPVVIYLLLNALSERGG